MCSGHCFTPPKADAFEPSRPVAVTRIGPLLGSVRIETCETHDDGLKRSVQENVRPNKRCDSEAGPENCPPEQMRPKSSKKKPDC